MSDKSKTFEEWLGDSGYGEKDFLKHKEYLIPLLNAWNAAIESMQEEIDAFKKENSILRSALNRLYGEVSSGEHLDKEWIRETIKEEVKNPVIDAALKMYESYKKQNINLRSELDKRDARIEDLEDILFIRVKKELNIGVKDE